MNKISKAFYLTSLILCALGLAGGIGQTIEKAKLGPLAAQRAAQEAIPGLLIILIYLTFVVSRLFYRAWAAIQDGHARVTPGQAVGFLFIPFYNFYWMFVAIHGYAGSFNAYIARHGIVTPPLPAGLFLAYCILVCLGIIPPIAPLTAAAAMVILIIMAARICDGVNAIVTAPRAASGPGTAPPPPILASEAALRETLASLTPAAATGGYFAPERTRSADEAVGILFDRALPATPDTTDAAIETEYTRLRPTWSSRFLARGAPDRIRRLVASNLRRIADGPGFHEFEVKVYPGQHAAQVEAEVRLGRAYCVPVRVWRSGDAWFACGNADFADLPPA